MLKLGTAWIAGKELLPMLSEELNPKIPLPLLAETTLVVRQQPLEATDIRVEVRDVVQIAEDEGSVLVKSTSDNVLSILVG